MIIVTGGAGFIGSALIAHLNKLGYEQIIVVDHLAKNEKWKNLSALKFYDYYEKDHFVELVQNGFFNEYSIDRIYHFGACSSTVEQDASYLVANNFQFSKIIAQWAFDIGARLVYASSAATYGNGEKGFDDSEGLSIQNLRPLNMYGYSKQMFDLWMQKKGYLDSSVALKFFNVYGPNEYHKADMRSFVLKAYEQINSNGTIKLFKSHRSDYADGEQLRDFIYIKDAVAMAYHCMENATCKGIYNIATGKTRSWNELASIIFKILGKAPSIQYVEMPETIKNQYQYFTEGNITRLLQTGYTKKISSLEEGVEDYIKNYLINNSYLGDEKSLHFLLDNFANV